MLNGRTFRGIISTHLLNVKGKLCLAALCLIGVITTQLLAPWPLKIVVDYILLANPLPPTLTFLTAFLQDETLLPLFVVSASIALFAILGGSLSYFQIYTTTKIGHELVYTLRRELFAHLQRLSLSFHNRVPTGEILTKFSDDTTTLKEAFTDWALKAIAHVLMLVGMSIVMFMLSWELSLVILLTLPVLGCILLLLNLKIRTSVRYQRRQEGKIHSRVNEALSSISLIQAFGREEYEKDRLEEESAKNLEAGIQTARTSAAVTTVVSLISAIGVACTVFFGAWYVLKGRMLPGDLLIFVAYVRSFFKPIRDLGKLSARFAKVSVSATRIAELLEIEPEITEAPHAVPAGNLKGDLTFDRVSFGYQKNQTVLNEISFHILPGQRVALVGASGAGKSTIVSLLLRLYDAQEGHIMIDRVDITHYQRESLRHEIGIVLQDTVLFGASIAENISYGKPDATLQEMKTAAQQAYAHDFIMALSDGYDTIVGEKGNTLSGGQRQRICLARAFIKRPSILILDEPTSAVDIESATLIRKAIAQVQEGKTTLFIAHQFFCMDQFDQILVLRDGAIVEQGTHEALKNQNGYYSMLYRQQTEFEYPSVSEPVT